ncbi:hypothetical protein [Acidaminobacterium chupaoyuni]
MAIQWNPNNAAMKICIDHISGSSYSGRIFSRRLKSPMFFSDPASLILQTEDLMEQQNFPQAFQRIRRFRAQARKIECAAETLEEAMEEETVKAAKGEKATFLLYVLTRRNSSWQGRVDFLDGSPSVRYVSALDLIRLVEEHLDEEAQKEE